MRPTARTHTHRHRTWNDQRANETFGAHDASADGSAGIWTMKPAYARKKKTTAGYRATAAPADGTHAASIWQKKSATCAVSMMTR
jgi:hypothetical protein